MPFRAQQRKSQGKTNLGAEETPLGMRLAAVEQWKLTVLVRVSVTVMKKKIEKCDHNQVVEDRVCLSLQLSGHSHY